MGFDVEDVNGKMPIELAIQYELWPLVSLLVTYFPYNPPNIQQVIDPSDLAIILKNNKRWEMLKDKYHLNEAHALRLFVHILRQHAEEKSADLRKQRKTVHEQLKRLKAGYKQKEAQRKKEEAQRKKEEATIKK